MKSVLKVLTPVLFFTLATSWMSCSRDNNPTSSMSSLAGTWNLATMTDKLMNMTFTAGAPTNIPGLGSITRSGNIVLTDANYTATLISILAVTGQPTVADTSVGIGTYTYTNSTFFMSDTGSPTPDTLKMNWNGDNLTLEDDEIIMNLIR